MSKINKERDTEKGVIELMKVNLFYLDEKSEELSVQRSRKYKKVCRGVRTINKIECLRIDPFFIVLGHL